MLVAAGVTAAAAYTDPAGTVETSPVLSSLHSGFTIQGSGERGWVQYGTDFSGPFQLEFYSASTRLKLALDHPELVSPGSGFQFVAADHVIGIDGTSNQFGAVDLATGHVSVFDGTAYATGTYFFYLSGATSVGWVVQSQDVDGWHLYVQPFDGSARTEIDPTLAPQFLSGSAAGLLVGTREQVDLGAGPVDVYRLRLYSSDGSSSRVVDDNLEQPVSSADSSATTVAWVRGDGTWAHQPAAGGPTATSPSLPDLTAWRISAVAGDVIGLIDLNTFELSTWVGANAPTFPILPVGYGASDGFPRASSLTDGTPALMVQGRYTISTEQGRGAAGMLASAERLIPVVRKTLGAK